MTNTHYPLISSTFSTDWLIITNINVKGLKTQINKLTKKSIEVNVEERSTSGGVSRQYDIFSQIKYNAGLPTPSQKYFHYIRDEVQKALHLKFNHNFNLQYISGWTVKGEEHTYHTLHKHNYKNKVSVEKKNLEVASVVYLDVPKYDEKHSKDANNFYCVLNNEYIKYYSYKPKIGDLIIFPIWLWHGSYPQTKGTRQTLNLDFKLL